MNQFAQRWSLFAVVAGFLVIVGCSSKGTNSETPAASTPGTPQAAAPAGEAEEGEASSGVVPAATVGEIWTQIGNEQAKLSAAIQSGELKGVHLLAFGIRDLTIALADKANAASPARTPQIDGMIDQVKESAARLDELGDAGNLSGTQAEYARFEKTLVALKAMTAAQ